MNIVVLFVKNEQIMRNLKSDFDQFFSIWLKVMFISKIDLWKSLFKFFSKLRFENKSILLINADKELSKNHQKILKNL